MTVSDEFGRYVRNELEEGERLRLEARLANQRRASAKERRTASKERATADAVKMMRNGELHRVFKTPIARQPHRTDETRALQDRLADQQRSERLRSIRTTANDQFTNFRKGFDE